MLHMYTPYGPTVHVTHTKFQLKHFWGHIPYGPTVHVTLLYSASTVLSFTQAWEGVVDEVGSEDAVEEAFFSSVGNNSTLLLHEYVRHDHAELLCPSLFLFLQCMTHLLHTHYICFDASGML